MLEFTSRWLVPFVLSLAVAQEPQSVWQEVQRPCAQSLRGLAVVDANTLWVGGAGGSLWRSTDAGATWRDVAPPDTEACDFRDLEAFSADEALAMVAGQPARVYRTTDGGKTWTIVHVDARKEAFFDGIAFAGAHGILFGDPIDGAFEVFTSGDRGATWQRVAKERLPEPLPGEAAFAASGTCVAVSRDGGAEPTFWIATGGGARARLLQGHGGDWTAVDLPLQAGAASRGAFGLAVANGGAVVVGGDYQAPAANAGSAAYRGDDADWLAAAGGAGGFRSAAVWLDAQHLLAVGSHGTSASNDAGRTWQVVAAVGFHAVARGADGAVFACGADGRVARRREATPREFTVHALFGDHMVLPAATTVPVRGSGPAGARVVVRGSWGKDAQGAIDPSGNWTCNLPTPARGGPFTVEITCGEHRRQCRDVLVGDVWLASGQSNMEMELGKHGWSEGVRDWQREVAAADLPSLRFFTVGKNAAEVRAEAVDGEWVVCSPATAGTFSATAFFFARELLQAGKGPLGVVVSAWGGTVCEAWTSPTGLATFPEFAAKLTAPTGHAVSREQRRQQFWAAVDAAGVGAPAIDVELPGAFSATGLGDFDGAVEYRRRVALPEALRGHDLWLELGPIDDMDTVWWGERQLGGADDDGAWSTPRRYRVPAAWTAVAAVELRVRVVDTGGEGGLTGDSASMRLAGNDQAVPLAGTWQRRLVAPLASLPPWPRRDDPNQPARLWHGMIAPLVPFPFTGAIWYQGESNRGRATQYAKLFPAMIEDWRRAFAGPLPFYFVQIAPYEYGPAGETKTAELRAAQAAALALPNTGMVVTLDCGDAKDIHPTHKQPVGQRLAALARAGHYGDAVPHRGPVATTARRERDAVELTFDAPAGVRLANDGAGFELASADGRFVPATAEVRDGKVVVRAAGIAEPNHVRYAWAAVPAWSLLGGDGCLAAPFALVVR